MARQLSKYDLNLEKCAANFQSMSPVGFVARSATAYPEKIAVIAGERRFSYFAFYERCRRLASALTKIGLVKGDTVSVMAANVPALLEAHYGIPMIGAVVNALNIRLDADTIAFILPRTFRKASVINRLSEKFNLILETMLPKNSFHLPDELYLEMVKHICL